jgi:hypothetical protein
VEPGLEQEVGEVHVPAAPALDEAEAEVLGAGIDSEDEHPSAELPAERANSLAENAGRVKSAV